MKKQDEARRMALATLAASPPAEQLISPLDFIVAEHFRQRTLCWTIGRIAEAEERDQECVGAVLRFLREDLEPHVIDEEEDLFPLLRRRAEPEDRIEDVLGRLSREHAAARTDAAAIVAGLSRPGTGRFSEALRDLLNRFGANERRHLIVENAIVLPLARARLKADDLRSLGRRMAARRGVDFPGEPPC